MTLQIPETQPLHALGLDLCAGAGEVRLDGLKITDSAGKVLQQWP
jgi:hypothetical protein